MANPAKKKRNSTKQTIVGKLNVWLCNGVKAPDSNRTKKK